MHGVQSSVYMLSLAFAKRCFWWFFCRFSFRWFYVFVVECWMSIAQRRKRIKTISCRFLSFLVNKIKHRFEVSTPVTFTWHDAEVLLRYCINCLRECVLSLCVWMFWRMFVHILLFWIFMCLLNWDNNEVADDSKVTNFFFL